MLRCGTMQHIHVTGGSRFADQLSDSVWQNGAAHLSLAA